MPPLTRWFVKAGLVYLVAALLLELALTARPVLALPPALVSLVPVSFHLFLVGWVTQLIFGVAYWMFPRYSKASPHRSESLAWLIFGLLNLGLLLRMVSEPLHTLSPRPAWGWLLALSALLQWLAGLGFVFSVWGRVKER